MGTTPSSEEYKEPYVEPRHITAKPLAKSVHDDINIEMGDQLGEGAFSKVFRGVTKEEGRGVAVKCVYHENVPTQEDKTALLEEVGILQEIHHPHVMRIYGFYEDKKAFYLVTEVNFVAAVNSVFRGIYFYFSFCFCRDATSWSKVANCLTA